MSDALEEGDEFPAKRSPVWRSLRSIKPGSRSGAHCHDQFAYRQECFSGSWNRCKGKGRRPKTIPGGRVVRFFEEPAPCLVGLEACATSHYWAGELAKLRHQLRIMPAKDVKAHLKRDKNDAAAAEAIREAARRPNIRFVQVKSTAQQTQLMQHRSHDPTCSPESLPGNS